MFEAINDARDYWLAKNLCEYDFVLLLPSANIEMNEKIKAAFTAKLRDRKGCIISGNEAKRLVKLYSLYEFSGNVIIGSFDEPHGCKLRNILNSGIASEESVIDYAMLGAMNGGFKYSK